MKSRTAKTIYFQYGQLERSLQINSLEAFVATGEVHPDLRFYFNFLNISGDTQQRFRRALIARSDIDPVYLSRFLYTELGEDLLNQFGSYIRTEAGNNGSIALRAAVLLAATSPEGLSPMSILQQYPTDIRVDVQSSLSVAKAAGIVLDATDFFVEAIAFPGSVIRQAVSEDTNPWITLQLSLFMFF
ncbi:MAG: alpha/beta hydrolase [Synechococcales bacterium]|nr:alpha/beta hydrolase [Synechococcales bacterium]